jgi:hypothetical protein
MAFLPALFSVLFPRFFKSRKTHTSDYFPDCPAAAAGQFERESYAALRRNAPRYAKARFVYVDGAKARQMTLMRE